MLIFRYWLAFGLLVAISLSSAMAQENEAGNLVLVGGGGTPDAVMTKLVELADGGLVVVVPQASAKENAGTRLVEFFRNHGAKNVEVLDVINLENGHRQLKIAKLVWFGGGSQVRLMKCLPASYLDVIREQYRAGCHVGGTSAGAAVISKLMITGQADLESIEAGRTELVEGLSLTDLIVDQHFHRRRRFNRLLSAVLDNPDSVGIGIDEKTAALIVGDQLQVFGESSVLVVDATEAKVANVEVGQKHSANGVRISLLTEGQTFELPSED